MINRRLLVCEWLPVAANAVVEVDLSSTTAPVLRPGDMIEIQTEGSTEILCGWVVEELNPPQSFAERLYPTEQPAVQGVIDEMFADWSAVGSLQESAEARLRREEQQLATAALAQMAARARQALTQKQLETEKQPPPQQPKPTRKIRLVQEKEPETIDPLVARGRALDIEK